MSGSERNSFKTVQHGLEKMDVSVGLANWLTILERRVAAIEDQLGMDGHEWLATHPLSPATKEAE